MTSPMVPAIFPTREATSPEVPALSQTRGAASLKVPALSPTRETTSPEVPGLSLTRGAASPEVAALSPTSGVAGQVRPEAGSNGPKTALFLRTTRGTEPARARRRGMISIMGSGTVAPCPPPRADRNAFFPAAIGLGQAERPPGNGRDAGEIGAAGYRGAVSPVPVGRRGAAVLKKWASRAVAHI